MDFTAHKDFLTMNYFQTMVLASGLLSMELNSFMPGRSCDTQLFTVL